MRFFIVFCSPADSTRRVAETIKKCLSQFNFEANMLDLAKGHDGIEVFDKIHAAGERACLFIGSPVYRDLAVSPIISFIDRLPLMDKAMAVPYVTWGQACSGVALWQMGSALKRKGFNIVGAAKVLAVHSLMWQSPTPAGQGHPDNSDFQVIEKLVQTLIRRFESGEMRHISAAALDYQPHERAEQMKKKIGAPWVIVPKNVNMEKCSQCGICEEVCPAAAVGLDPYPQFGSNCFDCFNCIRLCPEDAIEPAIGMDDIEKHIRERVRTINELPYTQIFL